MIWKYYSVIILIIPSFQLDQTHFGLIHFMTDNGYMDGRSQILVSTNERTQVHIAGLPYWSHIQVLTKVDMPFNFSELVTELALVATASLNKYIIHLIRYYITQ